MSDTTPTTAPLVPASPEMTYDAETDCIVRDGVTYVRQPAPRQLSLKEFSSGMSVQVMKDGSWVPGIVHSFDRRVNLLYVHTNRGPVTVAAATNIRPLG